MNLCIPLTWDSQGTKSLGQGRGDRVPAVPPCPPALLGLACPVGKAPDGIERKEFFSAVRVGRKTGEKSRRFGKGRHILFVFERKSRAPFSRPAFHVRSPPHLFSRKTAFFIQEMRIRKLPVHIHGQLRFFIWNPIMGDSQGSMTLEQGCGDGVPTVPRSFSLFRRSQDRAGAAPRRDRPGA